MLERLRMQEVKQIILSLPEGAIIDGKNYQKGEPIMIIEKPGLSNLAVRTVDSTVKDGRGFIGASGLTNRIDFTINEGSILYSVWSYLNGTYQENINTLLKGTEWIMSKNGEAYLSAPWDSDPSNIIVYKKNGEGLQKLIPEEDFKVYKIEEEQRYLIIFKVKDDNNYFIVYNYKTDCQKTDINQIHNNIFCTVDIYFDAMDIVTEDKYTVCFHCDKAQIFMDMIIDINSSTQVSFTPIRVISIPMTKDEANDINKNIGSFMVI